MNLMDCIFLNAQGGWLKDPDVTSTGKMGHRHASPIQQIDFAGPTGSSVHPCETLRDTKPPGPLVLGRILECHPSPSRSRSTSSGQPLDCVSLATFLLLLLLLSRFSRVRLCATPEKVGDP